MSGKLSDARMLAASTSGLQAADNDLQGDHGAALAAKAYQDDVPSELAVVTKRNARIVPASHAVRRMWFSNSPN